MITETIKVESDRLLIVVESSYRLGDHKKKQSFKVNLPDGEKVNAEVDLGETEQQILDQIYLFTLQGLNDHQEMVGIKLKLDLEELTQVATTISKILQNNGIYVR